MRDEVDPDFAGYVVSRQRRLVRAAYLVCGDEHLAQDLVQQALTKLALRWNRLRDGNPDAYVNRILYRDAVSWWRRIRRERLVVHCATGYRSAIAASLLRRAGMDVSDLAGGLAAWAAASLPTAGRTDNPR